MLRSVWTVGCVGAALVMMSEDVNAQRPIELGQDASAGIFFNGGTFFDITAPISQIRIGFQSSENIVLEPRFSLGFTAGDGDTFTFVDAGFHVLYGLQPRSASNSSVYVTGGVDLIFSDGPGGSNSDFSLGGGVGVRIPILDQLAWRLEGRLDHQFDFSATSLRGLFGLSFFTR